MTFTFEVGKSLTRKPWQTIASLKRERLVEWNTIRMNALPYYDQARMRERMDISLLKPYINENQKLIDLVTKRSQDISSTMFKSVIFIFTSVDGIVLSIVAKPELITQLDHYHNVGQGSVFSIHNAGLNAINLAIELEDWVFLSGAEHDFNLFKEWNCFCTPLRYQDKIIGYLDMSFSLEDDYWLMAGVFASTIRLIEEQFVLSDQQQLIHERLQQYRLSPREREIGYMWLHNYNALRIASELGIAEGTVRNVIKTIYRKTEVCDKGQYMRKFLNP